MEIFVESETLGAVFLLKDAGNWIPSNNSPGHTLIIQTPVMLFSDLVVRSSSLLFLQMSNGAQITSMFCMVYCVFTDWTQIANFSRAELFKHRYWWLAACCVTSQKILNCYIMLIINK